MTQWVFKRSNTKPTLVHPGSGKVVVTYVVELGLCNNFISNMENVLRVIEP
jgi:hypothetical protein